MIFVALVVAVVVGVLVWAVLRSVSPPSRAVPMAVLGALLAFFLLAAGIEGEVAAPAAFLAALAMGGLLWVALSRDFSGSLALTLAVFAGIVATLVAGYVRESLALTLSAVGALVVAGLLATVGEKLSGRAEAVAGAASSGWHPFGLLAAAGVLLAAVAGPVTTVLGAYNLLTDRTPSGVWEPTESALQQYGMGVALVALAYGCWRYRVWRR